MKKTITRKHAVAMFQQLGQMAIGHLNDTDIEAVMDNIAALQTVAGQYNKLAEELHKRLFEGVNEARCEEYDRLIKKGGKDAMAIIDTNYADIKALVIKKVNVLANLEAKEISLEIAPVERKAFVKAILKAQPKTPQVAFNILDPIFKEEPKEEVDLTELDELLK